jgi:PilZ domain-containing protein
MTHFPRPNPTRRAPRVQLGSSVPAAIQLDDGERTRAHLKTISTTGGVLHIGQPLEDGNLVEIAFQTRSGPVHAMAEILHPMRKVAEGGCLQPFRFIALGDDDHRKLHTALTAVLDRSFVGIQSTQSRTL